MSFEEVFTLDNLYKSYIKCCKGVNWKTSTKNFKMRAMQNVTVLYQQLKSGTYKSKGFQNFTIRERGKLRDIKAVHIDDYFYPYEYVNVIIGSVRYCKKV